MLLAIAFAGKIGSGKTTITLALADRLRWPRASFGDYVRSVARERGIVETRPNLQTVGSELLSAGLQRFCRSVLASSGWTPGSNLIIDGLRHSETVPVIRDLVRPAGLHIVFISVSEDTRLRRLVGRGELDLSNTEEHSSEQQVSSNIKELADLVIDGERPAGTIVEEIVAWLKQR